MASINYTVGDNWGAGFIGNVTVSADEEDLHGWTLEFDAGFTIANIWGAEIVSHVGTHYVLRSVSWTADVAAGGQTSFGFEATTGGSGTTASGFIINGEAAGLPGLSIADASVSEGDSGTHDLAFRVTLSAPSTAPVTVSYATANGTAAAGSDYTAKSGTLTFAAGETSKVVRVQATGDTAAEGNETLTLKLSAADGATIADGTAKGTIVNDDAPLPTLSISNAQFAEGSAATPGRGTFTVTLSAASSTPVSVHYKTVDRTAVAGSDYVARSGTLTFTAGETQKTIRVTAIGDGEAESNESFRVRLGAPTGATIADAKGVGTITNDDLPRLRIADASVIEGNPGTGAAPGWFSTSGNQIVDSAGRSVQIAGVNWFGFESSTLAPHGLWTRGYKEMMNQMVQLGFNTIRLPFSSDTLHSAAAPNGIDFAKNPDLQGLPALQIMDKIVAYAGQVGLRIILDHHRSDLGPGASPNGLWYDATHSDAQWVADRRMLANRYANNPTVIGADLHNEPYNGTWGGGGANDWAAAAERAGNAIGAVNANWLIFVEGIGTYQGQSYWWGGNLMGVKDRPIRLDVANKLVYSAHDYPHSVYAQPWFEGDNFATGLPAKFDQMWGYIYKQGIAPVYLGEFGTRLTDPKDIPWFEAITAYLGGDFNNDGTRDIPAGKQGISWTFWSWNPNSTDTGGILADDWRTVNEGKLDYLEPIEFDMDDAGAGAHADFVVSLSAPAPRTITVNYATVPGDAASTDFESITGSISFAPGEQSKTISITITPDLLVEGNEHFGVVLSAPVGATIARGTANGTIIDDDGAMPALSVANASVTEGNSNTRTLDFAVTLSAATTSAVTVDYATVNGSATAGSDYAARSGTLTFAPGETSKAARVVVSGDTTMEGDETMKLTLSEPGGATIARGTAKGTIIDDDASSWDLSPMFSPYIDMAMPVDADLMAISRASGVENFTLAFMLASDEGIGWQGVGSISEDTLSTGSTILEQVRAVQASGGHITISFGGAAGQEAALVADSVAQLQAEYQSVIDRYDIDTIDFDIEGVAVYDQASLVLRDEAIVGLQADNPDLKVTFTLPVLPTGLTDGGLNVLKTAKQDGVHVDVVNIMAMDYGTAVDNGGQMGLNAINAIKATERQLAALGIDAKIGVTPMIGVNDIASEIFTLADAQALLDYVETDSRVALLSMWSVARDNGNSAGAHYTLPDSSGIAQSPFEFSGIFGQFDQI